MITRSTQWRGPILAGCLGISALAGSTCLSTAARAQQASPSVGGFQEQPKAQPRGGEEKNILEEIVVTASRKRKEDVQHVPIAVTAMSAAVLDKAHVTNITQIGKLAPSLQILPSIGAGATTNIYLRGFGQQSNDPSIDPRVAVFIDGIYQPSDIGTVFDLFDVQTIEVQAGPQGTLLGKNAPVGAVYITSQPPADKFGGVAEATYGSYDHYTLKGKVNIPLLTDSAGQKILLSKFVFSDKSGGNWVYNDLQHKYNAGGESTQSYRAAFTFKPVSEFQWDLTGTYTHDHSPQGDHETANYAPDLPGTIGQATQLVTYQRELAGLIPPGIGSGLTPATCCIFPAYGHSESNFTSRTLSDTENVASNMRYTLNPVTLTLVAGYAGFWENDNIDDPGTPFVSLNNYHAKSDFQEESAEFRVSSNKGKGADLNGFIDWVVGGYFSDYHYTQHNNLGIGVAYPVPFPVVAGPNDLESERGGTRSEATFAHVIFNFTNNFTGTFGVRQSWDQKTHAAQLPGEDALLDDPDHDYSNLSFEGGLSYQVTPNKLLFFRFAEGYEAGGYDGYAHGSGYQPELVKDYEVGFKTDWLDRRLRVNGDIYRNDLSNLQVESAEKIDVAPGFVQETLNAGAAVVQGVETSIIAVPIDNFTAHLTLGYLDAHYTQNFSTACSNTSLATDCSGLDFAQAPKWTIDVGGEYVQPLIKEYTATFALDWAYKSNLYTSDPPYPYAFQKGYALLNAGVTFKDPSDRYAFEVYGTNITGTKYDLGFSDPAGLGAWYERGRPAEWGIRLTGKF